ncbi:CapA family protein [Leptospira sp. 96542]|nr:CapA family protein [Leptospira sp. 96542]
MIKRMQLLNFLFIFTVMSCTSVPNSLFKRQVRIHFVGDLMCHSPQLATYFQKTTKTYDSYPSFEFISEKLQSADLVFGNLETTIPSEQSEYSGYPRFGSPPGYVSGLKKAGFHILSTANNHSADKGADGIDNTIDTIIQNGMIPIGTYKNLYDYENRKDLIINTNGIRIAILNYTYSTNGIFVPKDRVVRLLDKASIEADVLRVRESNPDFIILWYHYGSEYTKEPDKSQKFWVKIGLDAGADIIIGGHPHVVQKTEVIFNQEKNNHQLVAYSLGNFLSAQNMAYTDGGILLSLVLEINGETKNSYIKEIEPVWVLPRGYKIIHYKAFKNQELNIQLTNLETKRFTDYITTLSKVMGINF